jgi:hypothetical protein
VTLGSDLAVEPTNNTQCSSSETTNGCLGVDDSVPGQQATAPFDGVIVRWRVRVGPETEAQSIRIRVVRRVDPDLIRVIASGPPEEIGEGAGIYTFPVALRIGSGDQVGIESGSGKRIDWRYSLPGAFSSEYAPKNKFKDGETSEPPVFTDPDEAHAFNVDVEVDCDHDGLGDETQDAELPPACKPPPIIPSNAFSLGKPKLNRKKGTAREPVTVPGPGVLTLAGKAVAPTSLPVGAAGAVNLTVRAKGKKRRKLNRVGSAKVKFTVTYTPTGGTPNSLSRKLVLKKRTG